MTSDVILPRVADASFALMLVDRGAGLAWHRAMLARPLMQSTLGNLDSSEAQGARVAARYTWDGKAAGSRTLFHFPESDLAGLSLEEICDVLDEGHVDR